jgi:arylsulfatase A-like enzyme
MTLHRLSRCALLAAAALASGCRPEPPINVLFVTIDTLRADHCSVSGYARDTTPRLAALAGEGIRAELAYAPTATTGPSHASMFTALYPIAHGVVKNGLVLEEEFGTLAEALRDRGYATAGVVSSFVLDARFGFAQGFDAWDAEFEPGSGSIEREVMEGHEIEGGFDRRADATTVRARAVLEGLAREGRPFLLFVHYFDPHAPYAPPEPWASRFASGAVDEQTRAIDAYDGEIAFADDELGKLLDALRDLGLARDTLVVVTSDHGEGLMQHGHMAHGVHLYEEAVRVPLLFRLPGRIPAGGTLGGPVELVDLLPTVLALAGHEVAEGLHGRSLAQALAAGGGALDPERPVHLHRRHYLARTIGDIRVAGEKFGVRVGPWKYIEGEIEGTRELFDLVADPGERTNLAETRAELVTGFSERIRAWRTAYGRDVPIESLSPEDRERLRALGYVE